MSVGVEINPAFCQLTVCHELVLSFHSGPLPIGVVTIPVPGSATSSVVGTPQVGHAPRGGR